MGRTEATCSLVNLRKQFSDWLAQAQSHKQLWAVKIATFYKLSITAVKRWEIALIIEPKNVLVEQQNFIDTRQATRTRTQYDTTLTSTFPGPFFFYLCFDLNFSWFNNVKVGPILKPINEALLELGQLIKCAYITFMACCI